MTRNSQREYDMIQSELRRQSLQDPSQVPAQLPRESSEVGPPNAQANNDTISESGTAASDMSFEEVRGIPVLRSIIRMQWRSFARAEYAYVYAASCCRTIYDKS